MSYSLHISRVQMSVSESCLVSASKSVLNSLSPICPHFVGFRPHVLLYCIYKVVILSHLHHCSVLLLTVTSYDPPKVNPPVFTTSINAPLSTNKVDMITSASESDTKFWLRGLEYEDHLTRNHGTWLISLVP